MLTKNGEIWLPYYKWMYMGPYSGGMYVLTGWRKVEKQEDVDNRFEGGPYGYERK